MKLRDVLVCIGLMLLVVVLLLPLRSWWFYAVLQGRSFPVTWEWLDLASLGVWAFEFAWALLVGGVVALLIRTKRRVLWAVACGALGGFAEFLMIRATFSSTEPWTTYVWTYGTYFVPMLGAGLGAAIVSRLLPSNRSGIPSAAC
jgi:CDP-diglyceride synthetase